MNVLATNIDMREPMYVSVQADQRSNALEISTNRNHTQYQLDGEPAKYIPLEALSPKTLKHLLASENIRVSDGDMAW